MPSIIYTIISSDNELNSFYINYSNLIIPNNYKLVLIDNRQDKKTEFKENFGFILRNERKISLLENIRKLLAEFKEEFFIRLDPDDYCDNDYLKKISTFTRKNYIISGNFLVKFSEEKQFTLNKTKGQYINYEPLGAGIIIHREIILESLNISYELLGQDNFSIWLIAREKNIQFLNIESNYYYMQDSKNSMSCNSSRIVSERIKLITRQFKPNSFLSIFYLRTFALRNKKFQICFNSKVISLKLFNLIFSVSLIPRKKIFNFYTRKLISFKDKLNYSKRNEYPIQTVYLQEIIKENSTLICNFDKTFTIQTKIHNELLLNNFFNKKTLILGL